MDNGLIFLRNEQFLKNAETKDKGKSQFGLNETTFDDSLLAYL